MSPALSTQTEGEGDPGEDPQLGTHLTNPFSVPRRGVWALATAVREGPGGPSEEIAYEKFILIYLTSNLSFTLDAL